MNLKWIIFYDGDQNSVQVENGSIQNSRKGKGKRVPLICLVANFVI